MSGKKPLSGILSRGSLEWKAKFERPILHVNFNIKLFFLDNMGKLDCFYWFSFKKIITIGYLFRKNQFLFESIAIALALTVPEGHRASKCPCTNYCEFLG